MTTYWRVTARIAAILTVTVSCTLWFGGAFRSAETAAAVSALRLLGARGLSLVGTTSVQVFPADHDPFRAVVTPSCSALSSIVAIICLGSLAPSRRRWFALLTAVAVVAAGNIVRIAASVGLGLFAGRRSLVLFHDWVGNLFTFVYTLGGFVLMIFLMLPKNGRSLQESSV